MVHTQELARYQKMRSRNSFKMSSPMLFDTDMLNTIDNAIYSVDSTTQM